MLIVIGGLPGTGKTTIARAFVARRSAIYLRIDAIEQAIRDAGVLAGDVGAAGYLVAQTLAQANLTADRWVVADCVNPVAESRAAWRETAARAAVRLVEAEVICSDAVEHRRRVESRTVDVPGLVPPTWRSVVGRRYDPWTSPHLILDSARLSATEAVAVLERHIDEPG